jgi:cyclopropane-fatty-acyl-phospholipid synthase
MATMISTGQTKQTRSSKHVDPRDLSIQILARLFDQQATRRVNIRLWDSSLWPDDAPRATTLVLKHPGALRAMFLPGTEVALGEAYLYDDFDIEGQVEPIFDIAYSLAEAASDLQSKVRLALDLGRLPTREGNKRQPSRRGPAKLTGRTHSIERDRQAVTYHYDVSNDFYSLFLDQRMVYSCGYFLTPADDIETAQAQKLEYICRKLRLQPGQRLLDIGCGWGGLAIYAARHYGVDVTGITLSKPQADLANQRIESEHLERHARVQVRDYRELDEAESFDALVSVGMFEHVGADKLPTYFERAYKLLRTGGVFLNHGIACSTGYCDLPQGTAFSQVYVFPDGELLPISATLKAAEASHFEVRDVESLREHYTLTLRQWIKRLEAHHEKSLEFVDEPIYRTWRLYMSGSAYGFATGMTNIYQTLLSKPDGSGRTGLPLSRADWYPLP